jgi:pimeloyl-ACP methyl ester carboxylesterase
MPFITVEGRPLHYVESGQGVPLLLLHGFPFSGQSFWPQLDRPPEGVRVIAPDHRGFGQSAPGEGPSTMEAMAGEALALLGALGLERAWVGGVSMGGYVALALARQAPERVSGLLLVDTQAFPDDESARQKRELSALAVETMGTGVIAEGLLPRLFGPSAPADVKVRVDGLMRAQRPAAVAAALRGMAKRADSHDVLRALGAPCLIVVGACDVITPPEKAQAMAQAAPHAVLEVVPDAGHLAHLERPEEVNALFARFLGAAAGR